jgi:hypothetical protein
MTNKFPILLKNTDEDYCIIHENGTIEFPFDDDNEYHTSVLDTYIGEDAVKEAKELKELKELKKGKRWV